MRACTYCRGKHIRCDKKLPRCSQCMRADVNCTRVNRTLSLLQIERNYEKNQVWLPVPPQVDFVLEDTVEVDNRRLQTSIVRSDEHQQYEQSPDSQNASMSSPCIATQSPEPANIQSYTNAPTSPSNNTPLASVCVSHDLAISYRSGFLSSEKEAFLFRHFIDHVSGLYDVADSSCHFAREVPQRARTSDTLLNAIFAISAKHRGSTSLVSIHDSNSYLERCLQSLIPALNDRNAVADDSIFAAVVLLRTLEELSVPLVGSDPQSHRVGTQAIISASSLNSSDSLHGLRRACYWTAFRQEFLISLRTQKPTQWKVPEDIGISEPAHDDIWALRAVQQCGKVADLIFDEPGLLRSSGYTDLMQEIEAWQRDRPASFDALFITSSSEQPHEFPRVHLHAECHIIGHQYNVLAHSLLISHMPVNQVGLSRKNEMNRIDGIVRTNVRKLCGVAKGNEQVYGAPLIACMAIEVLGDRFDDVQETQQLRDMLIYAETNHAWPARRTIEELDRTWKND